jgi:hypothetical protein
VHSDATGESHYEDTDAEMVPQNFALPAQPFPIFSAMTPSTGVVFGRFSVRWKCDWHPARSRQYFLVLTGECESQTSDGERRSYSPGSVGLLEDTTGKGYRARVVGDADVLAAVVHLPD